MKRTLNPNLYIYSAPVFVLGTYSSDGKPNFMTASFSGIAGTHPPSVSVAIRKMTLSNRNISFSSCFTLNVLSEDQIELADNLGISNGKDGDKLSHLGLTIKDSHRIFAPYAEEFPLIMECSVKDIVDTGLHDLYVAEIVGVKADEQILDRKSFPVSEKLKSFLFSQPDRKYYSFGESLGDAYVTG